MVHQLDNEDSDETSEVEGELLQQDSRRGKMGDLKIFGNDKPRLCNK